MPILGHYYATLTLPFGALNITNNEISLKGCQSPQPLPSQRSRDSDVVINSKLGALLSLPIEK